MSQQIELNAELRADVGKGASRRLRRKGDRVPGIIYGGADAPVTLSLAQNELTKAMESEAFYSQVLSVALDGGKHQAVVRDLQRHPATNKVMHVDFLRVSADKPVEVSVPLHFVNEEKCVGVRIERGLIVHALTEVEVSCLPAALPQYIEVDMENLHAGEHIHLSDLKLPEGVEIVALTYGDPDRDANVVSVQPPRGGAEAEAEEGEGEGEGEASGED
jgi:large subunit ribosomal protein L25